MTPSRSRPQVALSLENDRLAGVHAATGPRGLTVVAWLVADRPADVNASDAAQVGRWIGEELKRAKMLGAAKRGVDFAVPRGEATLKWLRFPPGVGEAELPGMVQLQMARSLTVPTQSASIDFVPVEGDGGGEGTAQGAAGPSVMAGAVQNDRIEWRRAVCRAAGVPLRRVGLQSAGVAAVLGEAAGRRNGAVLGVSLGRGSTEFVVIGDGGLLFARSIDLVRAGPAEPPEAFAQRVAVEAKRTAMSFRGSSDGTAPEALLVLGADDLGRRVAAWCGEALELPAAAEDLPGFVAAPPEMPATERASLAPLIGLLAEPVIGRPSLDFANPRRSPDRAAGRRRIALLGSLAAVLLVGGAFTVARADLNRRAAALDEERGLASAQQAEYHAFLLEEARVEHLKRFAAARVDWLSHVRTLGETLPEPKEVVLDVLGGRSTPEVTYTQQKDRRSYSAAAWKDAARVVFSLSGTTKRRDVADAFRSRLVSDDRYSVQTKGPDVANRFDWTIWTPHRAVGREAPAPKPAGAPKGGRP